MLYRHCFSTLLWNMPSGMFRNVRETWNGMKHISSWSVLIMLMYCVKT